MKKAIAQMIQSLLLSLAARSQLQELRDKIRSPAVDKGPVLKTKPPATQKDILGVCCDPLVLAQQLTHIELVSVVCLAWVGADYYSPGDRAACLLTAGDQPVPLVQKSFSVGCPWVVGGR